MLGWRGSLSVHLEVAADEELASHDGQLSKKLLLLLVYF
jgi:hypothetical protein